MLEVGTEGLGFRGWGAGFRSLASRLRVQGLGFSGRLLQD